MLCTLMRRAAQLQRSAHHDTFPLPCRATARRVQGKEANSNADAQKLADIPCCCAWLVSPLRPASLPATLPLAGAHEHHLERKSRKMVQVTGMIVGRTLMRLATLLQR